jgi:hypothetical protein
MTFDNTTNRKWTSPRYVVVGLPGAGSRWRCLAKIRQDANAT